MPGYDIPKAAPEPLRLVQRFVNTTDLEHGQEWLADTTELERWFAATGAEVSATSADLRRAHELRDALRSLLEANNGGGAYAAEACARIDAAAARGRLALRLDADGRLIVTATARGVAGALGSLVAILFTAVGDGTFSRLKACRQCRWAFYDHSRNRSASWCSMSICGNRLKTRRYRARRGHASESSEEARRTH